MILPAMSDLVLAQQPHAMRLGEAVPFSRDILKAQAERLAAAPYQPRSPQAAAQAIDYDAHGKIRFTPERGLFADGSGPYPVSFFHLGRYFQKGVAIHEVRSGRSREILYDPALFTMPDDSPAKALPANAGFAGFRLQESRKRKDWRTQDWIAFLGASYFRAIGELNQYGLSARGIAVNVATPEGEEFPDFTAFYIDARAENGEAIIHALLDGPSLTGAYTFTCRRGKGVVTEVECQLFLRRDIARLGIAPLTSMYWFSETRKPAMVDWRPEVHDSDGLQLLTGKGERLWRPLNNPPQVTVSSFLDENPRGFGLMQRDRLFDHYTDGVYYERRPSAYVEPIGDWGAGAVQLVEIPTDDEIHDNIVAMWVPGEPAKAGEKRSYRYRITWAADAPKAAIAQPPLARVVATRLGNGGQPGTARPKDLRKFLVEFLGGPLTRLPKGTLPQVQLWTSRGSFGAYQHTEAVPNGVAGHWRTQFDLMVEGPQPVELRATLMVDGKAASETWSYQYHPG
ncbi:MAG: glucan biosynthesis protein [Hyphomicrobiales bacterium]|nr:glucan biosynthesis protein [Hyphomicrobiales bacterium]